MKMSLTYSRPEPEVELWEFRKKRGCQGLRDTPRSSLGHDLHRSVRHEPSSVHECSSSAASRVSCSLRCPQTQLCLQHFALLSCPPLPWPCNAITLLLRRGEKGWTGRGVVWCHTKTCAGRTGLESTTPKGKSLGWEAQGSSVCCFYTPCPATARAGVGERQRALPENILICCQRAGGWLLLRTEHHPPLGKN